MFIFTKAQNPARARDGDKRKDDAVGMEGANTKSSSSSSSPASALAISEGKGKEVLIAITSSSIQSHGL